VRSYVSLCEFRVNTGFVFEFEKAYGPDGDWARLFRRGDGYLGTELLRDRDALNLVSSPRRRPGPNLNAEATPTNLDPGLRRDDVSEEIDALVSEKDGGARPRAKRLLDMWPSE
jgi:hypothetical protein